MTMKMKKQGVIKIYDGSPLIRFEVTRDKQEFFFDCIVATSGLLEKPLQCTSHNFSCQFHLEAATVFLLHSGTLITFMHTAPTGRTKWFEMLNRNIYILLSWVVSVRATCLEGNRLQIFWFQTIELAQQQHKFLNHSQICLWQQVPFWIILVQVDSGHDRPRLFLGKL